MHVNTLLTLPEDLLIQPLRDFDPVVRRQLEGSDDDFAVTRPGRRATSVLVDRHIAELLERFRTPRNLVDAVLLYTLPRQLEAKEVLEAALPIMHSFVRKGFLVDAEGPEASRRSAPTFASGDQISALGVEVVRLIHYLEDIELYQVRLLKAAGPQFAALKLGRRGVDQEAGSLANERKILEKLRGCSTPALLSHGELNDNPYLLLSWCSGVDCEAAARELRQEPEAEGRRQLLRLAVRVAQAYSDLHQQGVLHGDVHPRNLIVDAGGNVTLIDFGVSRSIGDDPSTSRPGVAFYFEPEHVRSLLAGAAGCPVTPAGEQYAVASLIYRLFTGSYTRDFRLEREAMLRQLAEDPVLPFTRRGAKAWPEVEQVLSRALATEPEARFPAMADLAAALAEVPVPLRRRSRRVSRLTDLQRRSEELVAKAAIDGPWLTGGLQTAPLATVVHGAGGVACALLSAACRRGDAELLALADVWACHATVKTKVDDGVVNESIGLPRSTVGYISPFYTACGIHVVQALVARAQGNFGSHQTAVGEFLRTLNAATREVNEGEPRSGAALDLILGRAGVLLHCALISEGVPEEFRSPELADVARRQLASIEKRLSAETAISMSESLGMAHGWAGLLYATLQWCRVSAQPPSAAVERRLSELADLAEPYDRGIRWRWSNLGGAGEGMDSMPGWCNGTAGFVFLWTLAWRLLGDQRYLHLAEQAAWNAWESSDNTPTLCCGLIGRSYALLNLFRNTADSAWLHRARKLALRAAKAERSKEAFSHSLYRGETGLIALAADLEHPDESAMPFFEEEAWVKLSAGDQLDEAGITAQRIP